jgi:restriction endonuclease S subunit
MKEDFKNFFKELAGELKEELKEEVKGTVKEIIKQKAKETLTGLFQSPSLYAEIRKENLFVAIIKSIFTAFLVFLFFGTIGVLIQEHVSELLGNIILLITLVLTIAALIPQRKGIANCPYCGAKINDIPLEEGEKVKCSKCDREYTVYKVDGKFYLAG